MNLQNKATGFRVVNRYGDSKSAYTVPNGINTIVQ